ncbi:MAG: ABC-type antimicrobial peptide transport system, ATPase component [Frankiales bacterium]|nr:ABC-type antimicrobial peptide transport system, ATPase component [Frankiales bacterium]
MTPVTPTPLSSAEDLGPLYEIAGLRRTYPEGAVTALDGIDLCLSRGELVAIEGTSGSGKSTLLAILGGLDRPSAGSVRFDGSDMSELSDSQLTSLRGRDIGFVFQGFNLIPTLSAVQNVMAVMGSLGLSPSAQRARALELLARVGLAARAQHLPSRLSGGEQQRVAIARALANGPRVVLADEPTGNLDSATAEGVMALLRGLGDDLGVTVVLVTHDPAVAAQAPRRVLMRDGLVISDRTDDLPTPARPVVVRDNVIALPTARRAGFRPAALVAQAAALVAMAGVGAVSLMPQSDPASAQCGASCTQAAPVVAIKPHAVQPQPRVAAVKPSPTAAVVAPASHLVTRAVYREPAPVPTTTPVQLPVTVPVVKLPKPVVVPTVPVEVPVPEVPVPTPSPTTAPIFSPGFGWTGTSMMDLWLKSMQTGSTGR